MISRAAIPEKKAPIGMMIMVALMAAGIGAAVHRYASGLGAMSDMSDGRPWGLWISFDLYCGVALAAGGFVTAFVVHILNLEKYHSVARPAILTAFLGYLLVVFALLIDLGQPWYIWHAIIYWNIHSPLFEVAWCVMLYTSVLALEISPAVFERLHWNVPLKVIRWIQLPLMIAAVTLSCGHQSSLGTMTMMMPDKLNTMWYTNIMPLLFLVSAIAVGLAMIIFESTLSGKAFNHQPKLDVLGGLGRAIPFVLGAYLLLKVGSLVAAPNGAWEGIFNDYPVNLLWWAEVLLGVVLPIVLFSLKRVRQSRKGLFVSALLLIGGLILNRFNVTLFALEIRPGYSYFPSIEEFAVSIGLVAGGVFVFTLANKYLPIAEHAHGEEEASAQT